jgi:3-oxoacyl-(acyl-carrier-protein) synthase
MIPTYVHGWGAVSPVGWGIASLMSSLAQDQRPASTQIQRPDGFPISVHKVPIRNPRPPFLALPRLRRASPTTHFIVGAGLEALGLTDRPTESKRVGVICSVMGGSVIYSERFYGEVLAEPRTASPLLFPETVYNAPASHLSSVLGSTERNYTLVADQTGFLDGLSTAATCLNEGLVESCVIIGGEEVGWATAEAGRLLSPFPIAEGAGAVLLSTQPSSVRLKLITRAHPFVRSKRRSDVWSDMINELLSAGASVPDWLPPQKPGDSLQS